MGRFRDKWDVETVWTTCFVCGDYFDAPGSEVMRHGNCKQNAEVPIPDFYDGDECSPSVRRYED